MTGVRLGVGCERQSKVLFRIARKPPLLFRHRSGVCPQKGKSVQSVVELEIIQFSRLRLVDALTGLIETLRGKGVVGESQVITYPVRPKAQGSLLEFHGFLILPLLVEH